MTLRLARQSKSTKSVIPQQFSYRSFLYPPSFFSQCLPLSFPDTLLSLPHVSLFLIISPYPHHCSIVLCRLRRSHLVCRLSSVPLKRSRLAPSSGRADSILYADYHSSLYKIYRGVYLHPLALGFCLHTCVNFLPCDRLPVSYCTLITYIYKKLL